MLSNALEVDVLQAPEECRGHTEWEQESQFHASPCITKHEESDGFTAQMGTWGSCSFPSPFAFALQPYRQAALIRWKGAALKFLDEFERDYLSHPFIVQLMCHSVIHT